MNQGSIPVGINFDAKVRRESTDNGDLFIAHIGGMDSFRARPAQRRQDPLGRHAVRLD